MAHYQKSIERGRRAARLSTEIIERVPHIDDLGTIVASQLARGFVKFAFSEHNKPSVTADVTDQDLDRLLCECGAWTVGSTDSEQLGVVKDVLSRGGLLCVNPCADVGNVAGFLIYNIEIDTVLARAIPHDAHEPAVSAEDVYNLGTWMIQSLIAKDQIECKMTPLLAFVSGCGIQLPGLRFNLRVNPDGTHTCVITYQQA